MTIKNILIITIIAIILIGIGTWGYNYAYTKGKADGGNEFYQSIITSLQKEPYIYLPVTTQDGKAAAIKLGVFADEKGQVMLFTPQ